MPIKITDLEYVYGAGTPFAKHALKNINLTIEDGEFWGVIGHTGSGKSTLFSHLNALTRIQRGTIEIDEFKMVGNGGKKLKRKNRPDFKALRARVGMVFQYPEYQLFAETVAEDVAFGAKNVGIKGEELDGRVRAAIQTVGLDYNEVKDRSPFDLSGGQKRRVALAGVLAMHPKILVLDEPTAGLDPRGKKEILDLILRVKKELCHTVIMISHNMDEVARYCDKIAVMADGELKLTSTPAELFTQTDLLQSLHIEMPAVTALACELNARGCNVSRAVLTEEQLVQEILRAKGVAT
ncbi:MAG: energy-coupling factor transporter ATPase [Clostridia bacterium]|jgi:energy-coupling factor transport system ATP-binding protein|nr:energy-coupling factor transporter ATPase [Clostridia bacterium]